MSEQFGFPPPLLGEQPLRLKAAFEPGCWLAVEKPAGIWARPDSSIRSEAPSLDEAIWKQLQRQLPSWQVLKVEKGFRPRSAFPLDVDVEGVGLWGLSEPWSKRLRNACGSGEARFEFEFFSKSRAEVASEFQVNLPVAQHLQDPHRWLISHKTGKKSLTHFAQLATWPRADVALWKALTEYPRGHQVRVHAQDAGIAILNDTVYGGDSSPALVDLKRRRVAKRDAASIPMWPGLNLRLASVSLPDTGEITFDRSRAFQTLLRKLDEFGQ